MNRTGSQLRAFLLVLFLTSSASASDFEIPELRSAVTDRAGILSRSSREQLESALQHLKQIGGTQLAVLTVPSLAGLTIEQASIRVTDAWKLGSKQDDKGVLLFVAPKERKVRIEVGQGLEGSLTDAYSKRIIDEGITPLFRTGDMNGGVVMGVFQIAQITNPGVDLTAYLEGHIRAPRERNRAEASPWHMILYGLMLLFVFSMRSGMMPFLFMGSMGGHRGQGSMGGFGAGGGGGASGGW